MAKQIEFFYDCSSPWTYLAFTRIEELARRHGADLIWKPILVGGVFNAVNPSVYENRAHPVKAKARYADKDLQDWAALYGLKIGHPSVSRSIRSRRCAGRSSLRSTARFRLTRAACSRAYWGEDRDIGQDAVIREIVRAVGLDEAEFFAKIALPEYKDKLRANTDELIERGGFGSPTMFVDGSMFFGNDRLVLVEHALSR